MLYRDSRGLELNLNKDQEELYKQCIESYDGNEYNTIIRNCAQVQGRCLTKAINDPNVNFGGLTPSQLEFELKYYDRVLKRHGKPPFILKENFYNKK